MAQHKEQSIVIRRVTKKYEAHHGGSWKIAFADFATAMMAFFLVLWLLEMASDEELAAVAGYFNDPAGFSEKASPYVVDLEGKALVDQAEVAQTPEDLADWLADQEQLQLDELARELHAMLEDNPVLSRYREQLMISTTPDGLRIQIIDTEQLQMFASGKDELNYYFEDILLELAPVLGSVRNPISITGHTDASRFSDNLAYSNWELSADRANTARRTLVFGGVPETHIAQVAGLGASTLFDEARPESPINRRIDILLLNKRAAANLKRINESRIDPEIPAVDTMDMRERARRNQPDF